MTALPAKADLVSGTTTEGAFQTAFGDLYDFIEERLSTGGQPILADVINEATSGSGVTIDSVLIKDSGITTAGDMIFASAGESNFFFLDYSANTLQITADTNATTDFPLQVENTAQNVAVGIGAYGFTNQLLSSNIDFTFTFGDDVWMKFENDFFFENAAQTFSHVVANNDFLLRSTAGGDIFQMTDAGATDVNNANVFQEWHYSTTIGGSQTRMGLMGFTSSSNGNFVLKNEVSGGHVQLNATGGRIESNVEHQFDAGLTFDDGVNTMDAYEEGTWTPTVVAATSGTPTYTVQEGTYTLIGDRCFVSCRIQLSSKDSAAGAISIDGLPFTIKSGAQHRASPSVGYFYNITLGTGESLGGYGREGTTEVKLRPITNTGTGVDVQGSEIDDNFQIYFDMTYKIA